VTPTFGYIGNTVTWNLKQIEKMKMPERNIILFPKKSASGKSSKTPEKTEEKKSAEKKSTAERIADKETAQKRTLLDWADAIADKVIKAALEDAALRFLDDIDDEELGSLDLKGEYDPIVLEKTGARLSDVIEQFAEEIKQPGKLLTRVYKIALRKKWKARKRKIPTDPNGKLYGKNYMVNSHGVWTRLDATGGLHDLYVWRRIARTKIDPIALSRDTSRQRNWRHRYCITDETGQFEVEIGNEKLAKTADGATRILMKHGVHVVESDEARRHLATFLRFKPLGRIIRAPRVGWFEGKRNNWFFILPDQTLGNVKKGDPAIVLDDANEHLSGHHGHGFHQSGTSEQWRARIAKPLTGNSNVVLAVGCFFANPLLNFAGEPGGGFHFYGYSKVGKTLIGALGQSVWGKPYAPGAGADAFGFTWESTASRIGQRALLRSDVGLYLDEIDVGERKAAAATVYKLAGGLDKGRYGQAERDFNILFVSTGEPSLAEYLSDARQGQLVRLVDIPAEVQPDSAFETISGDEIAAAGRRFYAATKEFHGTVGYDWLQHLVTLGPKRIKGELKLLRESWLALPQVMGIAGRAHPQVVSVVNRFALIAAALNMAAIAEIVPWSVADIDEAIISCMARWLRQRGNVDTSGELLREIERRRQMVAATIDDRFIHLRIEKRRLVPASAADERKMPAERDFDGYIKEDGRILVKPEAWQRWWAACDADAVKQKLLRDRLLIPGADDIAPSLEKFKSGAPAARFYVLAPAFIERV
jgi:hypothetical protein